MVEKLASKSYAGIAKVFERPSIIQRLGRVSLMVCVMYVFVCPDNEAWSQKQITDLVAVTVSKGRLLGIHRGEGIARIPLLAGESIVTIKAKGITGFAHTSLRLLGFSGTLQRWSAREVDVSEQVLETYVTPRMIIVVGEKNIYGFQGELGRWKRVGLRAREKLGQVIVKDHVAAIITSNQVLGFSAFTGGFFSKDLPLSQDAIQSQANDNIIILILNDRQLIFRSGLAIWAELR